MPYALASDIYNVYGEANVTRWADLDNDENAAKIDARITSKLALAESYIDSRLRGGRYVIPFATVPPEIVDLTAKLAGAYLYEGRGMEDQTENRRNPIAAFKKEVEATISKIRKGTLYLNATQTVASSPAVVVDEPETT